MTQQLTFSLPQARTERDKGIARVSGTNANFLIAARAMAYRLMVQIGEITADDVRRECERQGIEPSHYNAWGAVFKDPRFVPTGAYRQSANVQGHGNRIRVWGLV